MFWPLRIKFGLQEPWEKVKRMFSITKDINLNSNNISSNNKRFWRRIMNSINLRNNSFNNNNLLNNQKSKNRWNRSERKHYTYLHKMDSSLWNFNSNSSNSDLINELWTHIVNSFNRNRRWRQQWYNSGRENETHRRRKSIARAKKKPWYSWV
jgi:hypothetical protein